MAWNGNQSSRDNFTSSEMQIFDDHPAIDFVGKQVARVSYLGGLLEWLNVATVNDFLLFVGLAASTVYSVLKVVDWFDQRRDRMKARKKKRDTINEPSDGE